MNGAAVDFDYLEGFAAGDMQVVTEVLAARRFRGTSSAATVSIFLEPVAGIAQDSFCVGCYVLVMV